MYIRSYRVVYVDAIVVTNLMCTIEKGASGMHYADWKPANTAS